MAVTGDIFKSLTFDGESSRDYGVYITGQAVYNAPERDVEMVTIPGRSGAFALDKGRFENIEVTYPAGVFANTETEFAKAISDFRNMLCSRVGYCRLTDEYNPDEYRLAVYKSGLEVDPVQLKAGQFDITFECKPQRYLMSGENKFIVGEWGDTNIRTGERLQIDNTSGMLAVKSAEVALEPHQAGTPWQDSTLYKTPYLFQAIPNINHSINREYLDKIVGGTVAWNQGFKYNDIVTSTTNGVTFTINENGTVTVNGTATAKTRKALAIDSYGVHGLVGHKILFQGTPSGGSSSSYYMAVAYIAEGVSKDVGNGAIVSIPDTPYTGAMSIIIEEGTVCNNLVFKPQWTDLTQMFGTTIADYLYTLETGSAGAGVAFFRKLFPKPYYAYNAGELISVKTSSHNTVGFNQWDEEWEAYYGRVRSKNFIRVLPSTTYFISQPTGTVGGELFFFDADQNAISNTVYAVNSTFVTPSNATYMKFMAYSNYGSTYNHDICINLSWDGERDGEYEAYKKNTYPLDSDLELRGIPKLDASNNLYYDGDEYESDGTVNRKYGQVDLGTLTYSYTDTESYKFFWASIPGIKSATSGEANGVCSKYTWIGVATTTDIQNASDKTIGTYNGVIRIKDTAYTDAAAFKTAMSGVMLTYELATPTTETTDSFTNPQVVDNWGTEEFVDIRAVAIPVGNNTRYADVYEITGTDEVDFHVSHQGNITTDDIEIGKNAAGGTVPECARLIVYDALGGEDYHIVFPIAGFSRMNFKEYDADGNPLSDAPATTDIDMTITLEPTTDKVIVEWHKATAITESDFEGYEFQIGEIYTTSLGATVYKGTQEMVSGECVEEWTGIKVKNLTWTLWSSGASSTFRATISDRKEGKTNLMCEAYPVTDEAQTSMIDSTITGDASSSFVYIRDTAFSTVAELKATMGECLILYELDTSTTRSLTGHDIELINNRNMLWSDQGIITVEYGTGPDFIVNPTLFGCGPLIETKGYGNISFNGRTISLANGAIGTVNLWNRTSGGSLNGSVTKTFATGQFNPTDTFSFRVTHMFTLYEDNPSIVNTNANAVNDFRDNNDGSVTYWVDLPCTFTINTTGQITNKSTYTFGSKEVIANMTVSYNSTTGTVVYSVTTDTVNNPEFASTTQFGFTLWDCNATSTLDRLGDPTYIDCDLGEAYKINDGDVVSLNSFVDLGSNLPELAPGANLFSVDNTFTEVAVVPRWWTV